MLKFKRMKDIAIAIMEVALDTGYEYDFLSQMVDEQVAEGETYEDAFRFVSQVAYEFDF